MRQTFLTIPREIAGRPVFGCGWLLAIWFGASLAVLAWFIRRDGWNAAIKTHLPTLLAGGAAIAVVSFLLGAIAGEDGLPIHGWGVMVAIACVAGVTLAMHRARQVGVDPEIILSLAYWLFVAGIVGARLFYVIEYWEQKFHQPTLWETIKAVVNIPAGGLVVFGALIGAGLALVVFVRKHRLPPLALTDLIAPSLALGLAIGRVGCFLNGCCFGGVCELAWAVEFPADTPPYFDQLQSGQLFGVVFAPPAKQADKEPPPPVIEKVYANSPAQDLGLVAGDQITSVNGKQVETAHEAQEALAKRLMAGGKLAVATREHPQARELPLPGPPAHSRPVHPAQIYSAIDALLLCLFLLAYSPYHQRDGELTALLLTLHPVSRFLLELIRTDEGAVFNTGLTISQNVSVLLLCGAVGLWIYLVRQPRGLAWPVREGQAA